MVDRPDVVREPEDLYGVPLSEFVRTRDELVRRLRRDGDRDKAALVASMRKPTVAAWALDQVSRRQPKKVEWLLEAHRRLRESRSGDDIRAASESRNQIVSDLVESAAAILEEAGHSSDETVRDRMTMTLLAAAGDLETEEALRDGRLVREVEPSGLWPDGAATQLSSAPTGRGRDRERRRRPDQLRETARRLTATARELEQRAALARRALEAARAAAAEAERRATEAESLAARARQEAEEAEREE